MLFPYLQLQQVLSVLFFARYGIAVTVLLDLRFMHVGLSMNNSGGVAKMAGMSHRILEITDVLDAAGNGFSIGSVALV